MTTKPSANSNKLASSIGAAKAPATPALHVLQRWLSTTSSSVGKHPLHLMVEQAGVRAGLLADVRALVRTHYTDPHIAAQRVADLGAPATAKVLRELLPKTKAARSGDLGEILATETAELTLGFVVPIRRLRWKDGRNMALRGDDIVGARVDGNGTLLSVLKGESKSYAQLTKAVVDMAAEALDRDDGRPGRHAVLFTATRLRETGDVGRSALAVQLESAVLGGFSGTAVEHFLLVVTGVDPNKILANHLTAARRKMRPRHAVGIQITDHGDFIKKLYGAL